MSKRLNRTELPRALERGERLPAEELIAWAVESYGQRLAMTTAFGLNGVALIHMTHKLAPGLPVIFIDTGYHFAETLETKRRVVERYGINLLEYRLPFSEEEEEARRGHASFADNPELCCAVRKVETFQRALEELAPEALLSARSRYQSSLRAELSAVEVEASPVRINPLADWTLEAVERFVKENGIPYNPLHDQGYLSIGCWPCTRPVEAGEEVRAGRWSGLDKKECGIWISDGIVRRGGNGGVPPDDDRKP